MSKLNQKHKIRPTKILNLEGKLFEVETEVHHIGEAYVNCEKDCPKGWQIPTYWLVQSLRNSPQRDDFNLFTTGEYIQGPDQLSREAGLAAAFIADGIVVELEYGVHKFFPETEGIGVRYAREITQT